MPTSWFGWSSPTTESSTREQEQSIPVPPTPDKDPNTENVSIGASTDLTPLDHNTPATSPHGSAPKQDATAAGSNGEDEQPALQTMSPAPVADGTYPVGGFIQVPTAVTPDVAESPRRLEDAAEDSDSSGPSTKPANEQGPGHVTPERRQRLSEGFAILRSKHAAVRALRVTATELRKTIRIKKNSVEEAGTQYEQEQRLLWEGHAPLAPSELGVDFEALQAMRSELKRDEKAYETCDKELVGAEFELEQLETRMYQIPLASLEDSPENDLDFFDRLQDPTESDVSSLNIRADTSLEARLYLSQMGEVDLIKERLMDMDTEYAQVTEEKAIREDIGLDLDDISKSFLENFQAQREALEARLNEAQKEMAELGDNLPDREDQYFQNDQRRDSQMRVQGSSPDFFQYSPDNSFEDQTTARGTIEPLEINSTNSLLSELPKDPIFVYADTKVNPDDSVNKASYINCWLLYNVKTSMREVARLVLAHEKAGLELDPQGFLAQVSAYWGENDKADAFVFSRISGQTHSDSMATHSGETPNSRPASDTYLQIDQTNAHHLQRRSNARVAETTR